MWSVLGGTLSAYHRHRTTCQVGVSGLIADVSSLTEMMLSAFTTCVSPHFGHVICTEGGCSDSASARTFMCVPHLHCHTVTFPTIIVPLTSWELSTVQEDRSI